MPLGSPCYWSLLWLNCVQAAVVLCPWKSTAGAQTSPAAEQIVSKKMPADSESGCIGVCAGNVSQLSHLAAYLLKDYSFTLISELSYLVSIASRNFTNLIYICLICLLLMEGDVTPNVVFV